MVSARLFPKIRRQVQPYANGRVFAITGTESETGFAAARTAAALGGEVLLLNPSSDRAAESLRMLSAAVPDGAFVPIEFDPRDVESVRRAIQEIKSRYNRLYCLSTDAGDIPTPDKAYSDDNETRQYQIKHASILLLTAELLPLIQAEAKETGDARIVNHSRASRPRFVEKRGSKFVGNESRKAVEQDKFHHYVQSKLAKSTLRQSPTAFKRSSRPAYPVLMFAEFVRIKSRVGASGKEPQLVYTGIY